MSMIGTYRLFNAMENATVTSGTLQTYLTTSTQLASEYQAGVIQYGIFERAVGSTNILTAIINSNAAITYVTTATEATTALQLFVNSSTAMNLAATVTYARNSIIGSGIFSYIIANPAVTKAVNKSAFTPYISPYYNWTLRSSGTASAIQSLAYGNSTFVYVGAGGVAGSSLDGSNWSLRSSGTANSLNTVTYGATTGGFVAGGASGVLLSSPDGTGWVSRGSPTGSNIRGAAYGASGYVFVGDAGIGTQAAAGSSTDGISWTSRALGTTSTMASVAYGNGKYVATGFGGVIKTSTNAVSWGAAGANLGTGLSLASSNTSAQVLAGDTSGNIAFGTGGVAFAAGSSGTTSSIYGLATNGTNRHIYASNLVYGTSTDGVTWSTTGTSTALYGAAYGGGYFAMVGNTGYVVSSTDGATWATRSLGTNITPPLYSLTYAGTRFLAGGSAIFYGSNDGVNWGQVGMLSSAMVYGGGRYVTSSSGSPYVYSSTTWDILPAVYTPATGLAFQTGTYASDKTNKYVMGMGYNGAVITSTDSITWSTAVMGSSATSYYIQSISYNPGGLFIGALYDVSNSYQARLYTSTDGTTWSNVSNTPTAYAASTGVAPSTTYPYMFSTADNYYLSTNGSSFTTINMNSWRSGGYYISGLFSAAGKYLVSGNATYRVSLTTGTGDVGPLQLGAPYVPSNKTYPSGSYSALAAGGNYLMAVGSNGIVAYAVSPDWIYYVGSSPSTSPTMSGLTINATGTNFVAVGSGGAVWSGTTAQGFIARTSGTVSTLNTVITGNGLYMYGGNTGALATSTDSITWTARTFGSTTNIRALAYASGQTNQYVAVGDGGMIRTSTDGITWTARTSGTVSTLVSTTYVNNTYIVGGVTGALLTSTDAVTWATRTTGSTGSFYGLAYGAGLYVIGDSSGGIYTSTDAVTWTARRSYTTNLIYSIVYFNGSFVSLINSSPSQFGYSTDGINWTIGTQGPSNVKTKGFAYGNGVYVAVNESATAYVSTDAVKWTNVAIPYLQYAPTAVVFDGTKFIANADLGITSTDGQSWQSLIANQQTGVAGLPGNAIMYSPTAPIPYMSPSGSYMRTSTNGVSWGINYAYAASSQLDCITSAGGITVVGNPNGFVSSSSDGVTWMNKRITAADFAMVAGGVVTPYLSSGGYPVFVASGPGNGSLYYSTNGYSWSNAGATFGGNGTQGMGYAGGYLFASAGTSLYTSDNGVSWSLRTSGANFYGFAYAGNPIGPYVAVGSSGTIISSTDIVTWTTRTSGTASALNSVVYGTQFAAGGAGGVIVTSTDAVTWTTRTSGTTSTINCLAYGAGVYVAGLAGTSGAVLTSTDAITWTTRTTSCTTDIYGMTYNGSKFIAAVNGQQYLTSTNGITWAITGLNGPPAGGSYSSVAYGNGQYLAVSGSATLYTSTDGGLWATRTSGTSSVINAVAYNSTSGTYYYLGTNVFGTSTNAITWTAFASNQQSGTTSSIYAVAYGNNTYVYGGVGGVTGTSTDGYVWTARTGASAFGSTTNINSLVYSNGVFIASGDAGVLRSSTDGITWAGYASNTSGNLTAVGYGDGTTVYGGAAGVLGSNT